MAGGPLRETLTHINQCPRWLLGVDRPELRPDPCRSLGALDSTQDPTWGPLGTLPLCLLHCS